MRFSILTFVLALILNVSQPANAQRSSPCAELGPAYNVNFATNEFWWGRVGDDIGPRPLPDQGLESLAPWFIDFNHIESRLLVGPAVIWTKGVALGGKKGIPGCPNLVGATIKIKAQFHYDPSPGEYNATDKGVSKVPGSEGQLVFWFQSSLELPPAANAYRTAASSDRSNSLLKKQTREFVPLRIVNYVFNRNLLPDALTSAGLNPGFELRLDDDLNHWSCLGRNQFDNRSELNPSLPSEVRAPSGAALNYTCALNQEEFKKALSKVDLDMGLLLLIPAVNHKGETMVWLNDNFPDKTPLLSNSKSSLVLTEFTISKKVD